MKALVFTGPFSFDYREVDVPEIQPNEVLVRVKAVPISSDDVRAISGESSARIPPIIMGGSGAGIIERIGANVRRFGSGERVAFTSPSYCGKCARCLSERMDLCQSWEQFGFSSAAYRRQGGMAQYLNVPEHALHYVPDELSLIEAACIEPMAVAFHAARKAAVNLNDRTVVIGCGVAGLSLIQALRASGAGTIIAVDLNPLRLAKAEEFGADHLINPKNSDMSAVVIAQTGGFGADICFDTAGSDQSLNLAVHSARKNGRVILMSNGSAAATLPLKAIVENELTLVGSHFGEHQASIDMLAAARVDVRALISTVAPLEEGEAWFKQLHEASSTLLQILLEP